MRLGTGGNEVVPADPCPDLPVELGPRKEGVGQWVIQDKYRFLTHYLKSAIPAMRKWPARVYLDPFCATGRVKVRGENFTRPGGAAVAWHALQDTASAFTHMHVGDLDPVRANACADRLAGLGARVTAHHGPADQTVHKMVAAIPSGALCIAFIDPYNLQHLNFSILRTLATVRSMDVIVHFSTMDLSRNADFELDPTRARFDQCAPGWRDAPWAQTTPKAALPALFETYWAESVKGLGFTSSSARPLITNDRNCGLYRLYFFARHDLPLKLWGSVARSPNYQLF